VVDKVVDNVVEPVVLPVVDSVVETVVLPVVVLVVDTVVVPVVDTVVDPVVEGQSADVRHCGLNTAIAERPRVAMQLSSQN